MAAWPVVLRMYVDDRNYAKKIKKVVKKLRGVESVWASPEQGLVVVHGTADAWALSRRIRRKLKRYADVVSDGSAPYYGTTDAPYYSTSEVYGYDVAPPPQYDYYSHRQHHGYHSYPSPPRHSYYSHPPPQPGYSYAAGGYDRWAADPDPYGYGYRYASHSSAPACCIM